MNDLEYQAFQRENNQQYNNLFNQIEIDDTQDNLRGIGLEANRINKKNRKSTKEKKAVAKKEISWFSLFFSSIRSGIFNGFAAVAIGIVVNFIKKKPSYQLLF